MGCDEITKASFILIINQVSGIELILKQVAANDDRKVDTFCYYLYNSFFSGVSVVEMIWCIWVHHKVGFILKTSPFPAFFSQKPLNLNLIQTIGVHFNITFISCKVSKIN